ncbi:autotransporter-associated beta strand repeat-containing protein [Candidatus Auribacterota bacterium]
MKAVKIAVILMIFGLVNITSNCYGEGDYTWTGGGGDNNWTTEANWVDVPKVEAPEPIKFTGPYGGPVTSNNDKFTVDDIFEELQFSSTTGDDITITGDGLGIDGSIYVSGASAVIDIDLNAEGLFIETSTNVSVGELTINGDIALDMGELSLSPESASCPIVIDGVISGDSMVTMNGGGIATLSGVNTYTGMTEVQAGELRITGSIADSATYVTAAGVILSGDGTVGTLLIEYGGILSPGLSPGTMSAGNTTWGNNGVYEWEINDSDVSKGNDPGWDWLDITGTLNIPADPGGDEFTIDITSLGLDNNPGPVADFSSSQSYDWIIASASAGITGFAAEDFILDTTNFQNSLGGGSFSIAQDSNDLVLSFTGGGGGQVPEPSTILMMACLGLGLLWYKRRKV